MKKNVLLTDFKADNDWEFLKSLRSSGENWDGMGTRKLGKSSKWEAIKTKVMYFVFPLRFLAKRKKYDKILAWQQFFGLNLAFWCRLFHLKKVNKIYVMTFIYKPKQGFAGRIYDRYIRYIIGSRYIDKCICFGSKECQFYASYFNCPDKFVYVPLGVDEVKYKPSGGEKNISRRIFSTGHSNRDYTFLIESLADTDYEVVIACGNWTYDRPLPSNVTLLSDCYGDDMLAEMDKSFAVVIPLKDLNISSGQLVMLKAMQMRVPIIATKSNGTIDYITDGYNGLLIDNNKDALLASLRKLEDPQVYDRLVANGLEDYTNQHSIAAMAHNITEVMAR